MSRVFDEKIVAKGGIQVPQSAQNGYVWTSDASGNGSWSAAGSVATDTIWTAKGDLAAGTASHTAAAVGVGSALKDRLVPDTAQASGLKWVPHVVARTTDSASITSSTTLTNSDTLLWSIAASEVWAFQAWLQFSSVNTTMGGKVGWSVPASCTMSWDLPRSGQWISVAGGSTPTALLGAASSRSFGSLNGTFGVLAAGTVTNSTTAGTVTLQWAQNTSDPGALVCKAGSLLLLWRLA